MIVRKWQLCHIPALNIKDLSGTYLLISNQPEQVFGNCDIITVCTMEHRPKGAVSRDETGQANTHYGSDRG